MKTKFNLPKYYEIVIDDETGLVNIYSNSKHAKGRELSMHINNNGYLVAKLNNRNITIHSLVANFYLGERPENLCINHKDGNKLNNKPSNLEYVTIAENIYHSVKEGMHICNRPKEMGRYIDGRCNDIVAYKRKWYLENKQRLLDKAKNRYNERKTTNENNQKEVVF